jgi:hypothetical protein
LTIRQDDRAGTIAVYRLAIDSQVDQQARPDSRPALHPIAAPDGRALTEIARLTILNRRVSSGLTRVNGRDYYNVQGDHGGARHSESREALARAPRMKCAGRRCTTSSTIPGPLF